MKQKNISDFSENELKEELERREKEKKISQTPKPVANVDWSHLHNLLIEEVENRADGNHTKDFEHWVFETALEAVFGKSIWDWWNKNS